VRVSWIIRQRWRWENRVVRLGAQGGGTTADPELTAVAGRAAGADRSGGWPGRGSASGSEAGKRPIKFWTRGMCRL
jgi:hypothetical protein